MLPDDGVTQDAPSESEGLTSKAGEILLPIEVEFYIEADGTVVFADLAADLVPIAHELNPDQPLVCDVPQVDDKRDSEAEA